jgi:hypothetical protein
VIIERAIANSLRKIGDDDVVISDEPNEEETRYDDQTLGVVNIPDQDSEMPDLEADVRLRDRYSRDDEGYKAENESGDDSDKVNEVKQIVSYGEL